MVCTILVFCLRDVLVDPVLYLVSCYIVSTGGYSALVDVYITDTRHIFEVNSTLKAVVLVNVVSSFLFN